MRVSKVALAVVASSLFATTIAWAFWSEPSHDAERISLESWTPGPAWSYRLQLPQELSDMNHVSLQIRRSSQERDPQYSVSSGRTGPPVSESEAEMTVSTGRLGGKPIEGSFSVSVWLIDLGNILAEAPEENRYRTAGHIAIGGVSTTLSKKAGFVLGDQIGWSREQYPKWSGNEICIGRFRLHNETHIYDYDCVVVASEGELF